MSESETKTPGPKPEPMVLVPIPGGGVARLPVSLLEQHRIDGEMPHPPESMRDVTAHHEVIDGVTGTGVWHTEFVLGPCDYTDINGFPRHAHEYHNHPFGTPYTEVWGGPR